MKTQDYPHWELLAGALVEVRHNGTVVRTGLVEQVMPDGSAFWMVSHGAHPRRMFEKAEGFTVCVDLKELDGAQSYRMTADQLFPLT